MSTETIELVMAHVGYDPGDMKTTLFCCCIKK